MPEFIEIEADHAEHVIEYYKHLHPELIEFDKEPIAFNQPQS